MNGTYTFDQVIDLLTRETQGFGAKEFVAAPDVVEALRNGIEPAEPAPAYDPLRPIQMMTGVSIVEKEAFEPGYFRLIRHDGCRVEPVDFSVGVESFHVVQMPGRIDHSACTIVAAGVIAE